MVSSWCRYTGRVGEGASFRIPRSPALEPQHTHLVLTSRKDLKVLKVMKQFPPFLEESITHPMEMETAHSEGLLSCDTQATDICCPDIMSAKLSNVECFFKPHQSGVSYPEKSAEAS